MDNKKYFFDNPKNIKKLLHVFYLSCALLFVMDFVIHRHVNHSLENLVGFYPVYGFIGCVVLVLIAAWMRTFLMRDENYYDSDNKADTEDSSSSELKQKDETGDSNVDA